MFRKSFILEAKFEGSDSEVNPYDLEIFGKGIKFNDLVLEMKEQSNKRLKVKLHSSFESMEFFLSNRLLSESGA